MHCATWPSTCGLDLHQPDPLYLTEALWNAYRQLERGRVRGSGPRVLADLVSLVRHVALDEDIEPYPALVQRRYTGVAEGAGRPAGRSSRPSSAGGWTRSPRTSASTWR